jgi:hypothetical protein
MFTIPSETVKMINLAHEQLSSRQRAIVVKEKDSNYDRAAYTQGWISAQRSSMLGGDGKPNEWFDGYFDSAASRPKWHTPLCPAHHNHEGGCKQA